MFEIFVQTHFSAAHHLANYAGNCAKWHGHNWEVTATLQVETLNELGLGVDFRELKSVLNGILETLDHSDLNEHPDFAGINPTSEVIARHIYRQLQAHFTGNSNVRVSRLQVCETPNSGAAYSENP